MLLFTAYPYCAMTSHFVWASRTTLLHKQGQELRSEQTVIPLHEQHHLYLFLRLNNSETFVELVGARPLHLLSQTVLPLKSPAGAFIAALRFATASLPWQAEQAHHANNEKQEVPTCWVSVKQFSRSDMATACQDWLRVPS